MAALGEFDRAGLHSYVPKAVLLTQGYLGCMTAPGLQLDHRPDRKKMRTRLRLIDTNPPSSICLISFSDNRAEPRITQLMHQLTRTRSIHRDGLRGDPVKTFYRKLPRENVWHFCRNCEHWPRSGFEQRDSSDPPYSFCNGCIQMHRDGKCEWFNEEASPPRRS